MKKLLVLVFSCVVLIAASGNVFAANIVYTISGTLKVKINDNDWESGHLVTWKFSADTEDVDPFVAPDPTIPNMDSRIDNITGTVEIENLLSETALIGSFDIGASIEGATEPGVALSLSSPDNTPIIWLNHDELENYGLATNIGPLTCQIEGAPNNGPYETVDGGTFQVASLQNEPILFAANLAVPIPSTLLLLVAGLAGLAGLRRKFKQV